MKQFSHSKLQVYERCPLQYKFQYLTNLKAKHESTVEAFMGSCVHGTLELLYRNLQKTKLNSLAELLKFYDELWRVEWNDEIVINNKEFTQKHYFNLGVKCVENYYEKYKPFDQDQTLGVEKKINLKWGDVEIIGYVDRLAREKNGVYAVHDYKTNSSIMKQEYADKDRQLALYSIAVKQTFKEAKKVKLIWHFVAFGEDVVSERTDKQLEGLKQSILKIVDEIGLAEKEDNFPAKETLCEWCKYWEYCPKKKHLFKVKKLPQNRYLKDSGVKLVNKYIELAEKKSLINKQSKTEAQIVQEEMEKVEEAILNYANKHKIEALQGSATQIVVNKEIGYVFPTKSSDFEKYEKLENLLKGTNYWEATSSINGAKLEQLLTDGAIDEKMKKKIIALVPLEESVNISIRKNNTK